MSEDKETVVQMVRQSAKITAYAVEWFTDKFNPTDEEIHKALMSANQTVGLIQRLQELQKDRKAI